MNAETKHTPGPWRVAPSSLDDTKMVIGDNDWTHTIALLDSIPPGAKANAQLIASSPELLEACKAVALAAIWDGKSTVKMEYTIPNDVVLQIAEAIRKAEGGE